MDDKQAIDEITGLLQVDSLADAARKVREIVSVRPLVGVANDGTLHVAPMKVRDAAAIIAALESLTVGK